MTLHVISWNIFHGRDAPPDRDLHTWRSRLTGRPERGESHIQVNRGLLAEFLAVLADFKPGWDIALLQECPPRWARALADGLQAEPHLTLTSRNGLPKLRNAIADRNPDLIASGEGGSNLILVRHRYGRISGRRELTLCPGPRPERRTMGFAELSSGICVANLHASNDNPPQASQEILAAAEAACQWAAGRPLIFGGDFNLRPAETPAIFAQLESEHGLATVTSPRAIDHILTRGLVIVSAPKQLPAAAREIPEAGLKLRLSDHAPVIATYDED